MKGKGKKKKRAVYRQSCPLWHKKSSTRDLVVGATGAIVGATVAVSAAQALGRL